MDADAEIKTIEKVMEVQRGLKETQKDVKEMKTQFSSLQDNMEKGFQDMTKEMKKLLLDSNRIPKSKEVPVQVHQVDPDEIQEADPDIDAMEEDQSWEEDGNNKFINTEMFQTKPTITNIDMYERTINMGNTIFKSYQWVADQIETALTSRTRQDGTVDANLTPAQKQEKGNKQKKAINARVNRIVWNGQCTILEWVKWICDLLRGNSISCMSTEEKKLVVWDAIHQDKQQELDHIRPGSKSFESDGLPQYVARIVAVYEPELYSERFRYAYEARKQMRQESATRYLSQKWNCYRKAEPIVDWRAFVRDAINGLVCFQLRSKLYEKKESITDLGQFQSLLFTYVTLIRRDIMDPTGNGGSLAGLKVTQYDGKVAQEAKGSTQIDVQQIEEPDIDFGHEDLEVALVEKRNGCFNCGKEGHIKSQCTQPAKKTEAPAKKREQDKRTGRQKGEFPLICTRCKLQGHSARRCVCGYCMRPGHLAEKCYKKTTS